MLQRAVPVLDDDTPDSLSARILEVEHQLYPEAIGLLLSGQWQPGRPPVPADGVRPGSPSVEGRASDSVSVCAYLDVRIEDGRKRDLLPENDSATGVFRLPPTQSYTCQDGFEAAYRKHVDAVFRFALSCVRRRDVAEDLTSDAFLALFRNFDGIDQTRLPGWLLAVVRNRARDLLAAPGDRAAVPRSRSPTSLTPSRLNLNGGLLASPGLKAIHRVCLRLRYVDELSRV